jgi:hypothetical protein
MNDQGTSSTSDRFLVRLIGGAEFGPAEMNTIVQWAREGRVPSNAHLLPAAGGDPVPVLDVAALVAVIQAPPTVASTTTTSADDPMSGIIPYKNPAALTAYYLGLFSLLPLVGLLLAIPAFILGIVGFRKRLKNPKCKGAVHAWIGIVMGGLFTLIWGGLAILMVVGMAFDM